MSSKPAAPEAERRRATPSPAGQGPAADHAGGAGGTMPEIPEIGGPKGPEPTRYGDWERNGRCSDF
ncbi:MAG TPA: DUF1674 domain-containing protein [Geminicoccaceae bacterium]|nr:DUF1674 domain-containing protein [Geminicoccaceae bacterium]